MSGAGDVLGRAVLELSTDDGPLKAGLDSAAGKVKDVGGVFAKVGGSIGSGLATAGKTAAIGLAVVGTAAGAMAASCISAAAESQQVMAQTEAVIASTGGAAGLTADQVADLAGQLSTVNPIDDEVIQSAENVLLTFTSIGKDIFPQVTQTALDMSTALGMDSSAAAMQLGKALNDPIKGAAALRRVGVQLTDQQLEQIKAMQEAGDVAGAQGVILQELSKEYGGSAEAAGKTFAGQLKILKTQLGNVQEEIGARLLPIVAIAVGWFAKQLPGAIDFVMGVLDSLIGKLAGPLTATFTFVRDAVLTFVQALQGDWVSASGINPVHDAIGRLALIIRNDVVPAIQEIVGWVAGTLVPVLLSIASTVVSNVLPVIQQFASWFTGVLIPAVISIASTIATALLPRLQQFGEWFMGSAIPAIQAFATAALGVFQDQVIPAVLGFVDAVQPPLMELMGFLDGNLKYVFVGVGAAVTAVFVAWAISAAAAAVATIAALAPVIAVLAAIGVAAALLYAAWDTNFLNIQGITEAVLGVVVPAITTALSVIQTVFETVWPYIQTITEVAWTAISYLISTELAGIQTLFETVWPIIQAVVETAWAGIVAAVDVIHAVYDTISSVLGTIQSVFETVWPAVVTAVETAWDSITTAVDRVHAIYDTISGVLDDIKTYFTDAWDDVKTTVETGVDDVITAVGELPGRAISALGDLSSTLYNAGADLIQGFIDGVKSMIPDLDGVLGGITDHIPDIKGPPERDRKLLYDSGVMVMEGFNRGLLDGYQTVQDTMAGFTYDIGKWQPIPATGGGGGGGSLAGIDVGPVLKSEGPGVAQYCVGDGLVFSDGHGEKGHPACQPGGKFYTGGGGGNGSSALSGYVNSSTSAYGSGQGLTTAIGKAVGDAFQKELPGMEERIRRAVVSGMKQSGAGSF